MMSRKMMAAALVWSSLAALAAAQTPSPETALQYRPSQNDVDYDLVKAAEVKSCRVELETVAMKDGEKRFNFAVFDPNGLILRRYMDLNGDRYIDMYRYYKNGIEVFRDIDSNFNQKIDQCRWLNTGGSRWGIDANEDGKLDGWKQLSAEEASRVGVTAMIAGDVGLFSTVMVTREDLLGLGLSDELAAEIVRPIQEPAAGIRTVMSNQQVLTSDSKWTRFDSTMPGQVLAEEGKSKVDILVYENSLAFVDTKGKHGILQIGEVVKIGDVWKLTQIPKPLVTGTEVAVAVGKLMQPSTLAPNFTNELSTEMQKLLQQLQELDAKPPKPDAARTVHSTFHSQRRSLLYALIKASGTPTQRDLWMQQLVNELMTIAQFGDASGLREMKEIETDVRAKAPKSPLIPYIVFRQGFIEYSLAMASAKLPKDQQKANQDWLKFLEDFVTKYPDAADAVDAYIQSAVNAELSGDIPVAKKWYGKLQLFPGNPPANARGAAALRRLELVGKPLVLEGGPFAGKDFVGKAVSLTSYKGRTTLIVFWSMNSAEFVADVPVLRALHEKYQPAGFEILGVCLDNEAKAAAKFAQEQKLTWNSIHDAPESESPISAYYAIPSPCHYFLVDANGVVLLNNTNVNDLKDRLAASATGKK